MSFETEQRKLERIYNEVNNNAIRIKDVKLIQDKKETQVALSAPNAVVFNNIRNIKSEWCYLTTVQGLSASLINFTVALILPLSHIPFIKLNVLFKNVEDPADLFGASMNYFQEVKQTDNPLIIDCSWHFGVHYFQGSLSPEVQAKLLFTAINPYHFITS